MVKQKIKSEKGFTAMDASVAIVIVTIALGLIGAMMYNGYLQMESTHKNSMATFYAVEILENIKKLSYDDSIFDEPVINSQNGSVAGVDINENYNVTLTIEDYASGVPEDLIKIVTVTVSYLDNNIRKNIEISTLKLNM